MKTIITIQHTQSIHHTNGMVGSWTDWDLSELGVQQAKRIGEKLKSELQVKNNEPAENGKTKLTKNMSIADLIKAMKPEIEKAFE